MNDTRSVGLPPLKTRATFQPSTLDRAKRTVELTWTTGARVLRGFWERFYEELSLDPKHVHLDRLNNAAPFLADHDGYRVANTPGVVERAWLTKGDDGKPVGRALVRFVKEGVDPEADRLFEKIAEGVVANVSVGYRVHRLEKVADADDKLPIMRATSWTPFELSAVAIGADDGAGFRSADQDLNPCEVITRGEMPQPKGNATMADETSPNTDNAEQIRLAERARITEIRSMVQRAQLPADLADTMVRNGTPLDAARALVLEKLSERTQQNPTDGHLRLEVGNSHDSMDQRVRNMAEALAHRAGASGKIPDAARQYAQLTMLDMARFSLEARGISTRLMGPSHLLRAAFHTTSDFKALLQSTGERMMLDGYSAYPGGVRQISRRTTARDFRAKSLIRLSEPPKLLEVKEHGEVTHGTMAESTTGYALKTFARIFGLTRQAIINDDLRAFDMLARFGRAAAELEATTIANLLIANKLATGDTLFSSGNGNLAAAGSEIDISTLGEALRSMRVQKDLNGTTPLNIIPRFLTVPAALEVRALKYVAEIAASEAANVNPLARRLEVVVDPRLDAASANAWYVAADPNTTPGLEHCYLEGQEGPEIVMEEGFEVEGTRWKCRLDFNAAVVGHEGLYKNPGASVP